MQLGAERAEFFDQRGFGEMMNVFGFRGIEPRGVRFRARLDFIERRDKPLAFLARENSGSGDGARPRAVERQLLRQHPAIELPRTLELVE